MQFRGNAFFYTTPCWWKRQMVEVPKIKFNISFNIFCTGPPGNMHNFMGDRLTFCIGYVIRCFLGWFYPLSAKPKKLCWNLKIENFREKENLKSGDQNLALISVHVAVSKERRKMDVMNRWTDGGWYIVSAALLCIHVALKWGKHLCKYRNRFA